MRDPARLVETRPTGHGRARGLVSSRISGRRIEARAYAPADALADAVALWWSSSWDLRGQAPHVTELLADPCVNVVFEEGGEHAGSRVVGVWTKLWRRKLLGVGRVRAVKLRAGAVRAFFDVPAFRLANRIVPLVDLFPDATARLGRRILGPGDDETAFDRFGRWLLDHRRREDDAAVRDAVALVERIVGDPDVTTVERLAAVAGCGPRGLQRLFREHVGASPKWVIRRNRLQEAARRIERGEMPTLAALAAELGYSDQAHLARDFKSVVGKSPSAFAVSVHE